MSTLHPDGGDDLDVTIDGEWRKASREEPRQHVDAAILAAARSRRPWLATWQPLAAAAAVAGLAFLLLQLLPRERDLEPPFQMESREQAQRTAESAMVAPHVPAAAAASRSNAVLEPPQSSTEPRADGALAAGAPAPASAAESTAARSESTSPASPVRRLPPAKWAALIETLYSSGDRATAAAQLRAFRIEYPDADRYLPESLREWASTVE
jgi:hypothetical protein